MIPQDQRLGIVNNLKDEHLFNFSHIFSQESDQVEVFETLAKPVIQNCLNGYNGTIFAFGQTGSGKTYTMSGGDSWEERGIIPRVFSEIFQEVKRRSAQQEISIFCSYFEIYNENGFDLLDRKHVEKKFETWNKMSLFEDECGNLHLKNLSIHPCQAEEDAIDLLMMGNYIR